MGNDLQAGEASPHRGGALSILLWSVFACIALFLFACLGFSFVHLSRARQEMNVSERRKMAAEQEMKQQQERVQELPELRKENAQRRREVKSRIASFARRTELHSVLTQTLTEWECSDTVAVSGPRGPDSLRCWIRVPESGHRLRVEFVTNTKSGQIVGASDRIVERLELEQGKVHFVEFTVSEEEKHSRFEVAVNGQIAAANTHQGQNLGSSSRQTDLWSDPIMIQTRTIQDFLGYYGNEKADRVAEGEWLVLCDNEYRFSPFGLPMDDSKTKSFSVRISLESDRSIYCDASKSSVNLRGFLSEPVTDPTSPYFNLQELKGLLPIHHQ